MYLHVNKAGHDPERYYYTLSRFCKVFKKGIESINFILPGAFPLTKESGASTLEKLPWVKIDRGGGGQNFDRRGLKF